MKKPVLILSAAAVSIGLVAAFGYTAYKWSVMRVYVDHDEVLIVTNKFGDNLPNDRRTVKDGEKFKGVREEVYGPGRYFWDPFQYDTQISKQTVIGAGDPSKWVFNEHGVLTDPTTAPQIGLVTGLEGPSSPGSDEVAQPGYKGIQRAVLTLGVYKLNPVKYKVDALPATVVPPGSVGVVTRLVGDTLPEIESQPLVAAPATAPGAVASRMVTGPKQRGILREVLQPGIYYLNPRMLKVTVVPIGYDAITSRNASSGNASASAAQGGVNNAIRFITKDGYQVEADFTVVWGRRPADAPAMVANIGNVDRVSEVVIEPAMKAAAQNEGGRYSAKELIQGVTRSKFQDELSASLERQIESRNIHILLALIRNITVKDNTGKDQTQGLLRTIQQANIEVERELTNQQKTLTAGTQAEYEQALKQVDVAKETVASESQQKVANLLADGEKLAAQTAAQTEVQVAQIRAEVATLEAQRTQILGKAQAEVQRLKNDAEAQGAKLLVDALGGPAAYNQYIFAKNFNPTDLRLIFAGPGTFWTDLKSFQEVGAVQTLQNSSTTRPSR